MDGRSDRAIGFRYPPTEPVLEARRAHMRCLSGSNSSSSAPASSPASLVNSNTSYLDFSRQNPGLGTTVRASRSFLTTYIQSVTSSPPLLSRFIPSPSSALPAKFKPYPLLGQQSNSLWIRFSSKRCFMLPVDPRF